jgi:uric acid transporter
MAGPVPAMIVLRLLAAIVSVLLNLFFNGVGTAEAAQREVAGAAAASEHA